MGFHGQPIHAFSTNLSADQADLRSGENREGVFRRGQLHPRYAFLLYPDGLAVGSQKSAEYSDWWWMSPLRSPALDGRFGDRGGTRLRQWRDLARLPSGRLLHFYLPVRERMSRRGTSFHLWNRRHHLEKPDLSSGRTGTDRGDK